VGFSFWAVLQEKKQALDLKIGFQDSQFQGLFRIKGNLSKVINYVFP